MSNVNISTNATNAVINTPSTSPTTFSVPRPEKRRKSKDECPSPFNGTNNQVATSGNNSSITGSLAAQISGVKKSKSVTSPCAISPVLLECPEQDCSKKYKHANGLKYHQSHAHGIISSVDEDSLTAPDSPSQRSQSPPSGNARSFEKASLDTTFSQKINFEATKTAMNANELKVNSLSGSMNDAPGSVKVLTSSTLLNAERSATCINNESDSVTETSSVNSFAEAISKPINPGISTISTPSKLDAPSKSEFNWSVCEKTIVQIYSFFHLRQTQYPEIRQQLRHRTDVK